MEDWLGLYSFLCLLQIQHGSAQSTVGYNNAWQGGDDNSEFSFFRDEYIPGDYNHYDLPPTKNYPPVVNISVILLNIRNVDEKSQDVTVEMNLRLYWEEPRLSAAAAMVANNTFMVLSTDMMDKLWHPDVFIDRTIDVTRPTILTTPASVRLYPSGVIRYSARLTVSMSCEMDFHFYPGDNQKCSIHFMSYAYPIEILELGWSPQGAIAGRPFLLPHFSAHLEETSDFITNSTSGAHYRTLVMTVSLQRKLGHHVSTSFAPSAIVVILSWLAALLPDENSSDRIMGGVTLILALIFLYSAEGQTMPKVSYFTALDIWMVTCIIICCVILIGSILAIKLRIEAKNLLNESKDPLYSIRQCTNGKPGVLDLWAYDVSKEKAVRRLIIAKAIDRFTFVTLPFVFIIFNLFYWPWLVYAAEPYVKQKYMR